MTKLTRFFLLKTNLKLFGKCTIELTTKDPFECHYIVVNSHQHHQDGVCQSRISWTHIRFESIDIVGGIDNLWVKDKNLLLLCKDFVTFGFLFLLNGDVDCQSKKGFFSRFLFRGLSSIFQQTECSAISSLKVCQSTPH